jgi:hypothetical protein
MLAILATCYEQSGWISAPDSSGGFLPAETCGPVHVVGDFHDGYKWYSKLVAVSFYAAWRHE